MTGPRRIHWLDEKDNIMNRREFLSLATKGTLGVAAVALAGCNIPIPVEEQPQAQTQSEQQQALAAAAQTDAALPELDWEMATSWPLTMDTIFGGAQVFAQRVSAMTGGKFKITPRAAEELAPALQVLDAVQQGTVPIGHTASHYYIDKSPVLAFGTTLPFGLTARQQNAWLYEGGGLQMLQEFYKEHFNVIQFPAGNTGAQMGGWWKREIDKVSDLQGFKVRVVGLGGQVMSELGADVQVLAGDAILQALQTGAIDAAEWIGPYDDEKMGLQNAADFYYAPGWWEPGPTIEVEINLDEYNKLPDVYKEIVQTAAQQANTQVLARYDGRNFEAMRRLQAGGTQLRAFSDDIMSAAKDVSFALYDEFSQQDADFKSIYDQWKPFRDGIQAWHSELETVYLDFIKNNP